MNKVKMVGLIGLIYFLAHPHKARRVCSAPFFMARAVLCGRFGCGRFDCGRFGCARCDSMDRTKVRCLLHVMVCHHGDWWLQQRILLLRVSSLLAKVRLLARAL